MVRRYRKTYIERIKDEDVRECVAAGISALPERLRGMRESAGLPLEQVAEAVGVTYQALSGMERGVYIGSVAVVHALAVYYGVSVDWLLGGEWQ